ncbi:MAG: CehA/McbA family metallohydrolase [Anaerolineae bacterium]|nr:CehA/McbA family metallohydrolase [Anaerolineae bacterium]
MQTTRYHPTGTWFKGNAHIHSTHSDGGKTVAELAEMYAGEGYDFIFLTDHWVASQFDVQESSAPLLLLDGVELHGRDAAGSDYHVVCLGTLEGISRDLGFVAALDAARAQGALRILAHPLWMANSFEDALRHEFDGVEVYNHVCHWLNGKGDGGAYWHAMLAARPGTLGLAVDDAHIVPQHPGWNGGWIMVQAGACTRAAILEAIRAGRFYSTCGPQFYTIVQEGRTVSVETSPVRFARLVGPGSSGKRVGFFDEQRLEQATFDIPESWAYAYLEIEDADRRRAWTNALLLEV